jgi:hypothetical protein
MSSFRDCVGEKVAFEQRAESGELERNEDGGNSAREEGQLAKVRVLT